MEKTALQDKLSSMNVVIASHVFASGPSLDLEEYLKDKVRYLLYIGHPFAERTDVRSFCREYRKGTLVRKHEAYPVRLSSFFVYFKEAFYTMFWLLFTREKIDLYIGSDNYMAYLGLLAKKTGRVRKVVLYTIDFVPKRFKNPALNWLYHFFDRECLNKCDMVWNVSSAITQAREEYYRGLRRCAKQIVVPLGIWHDRISKLPFTKRSENKIIFLGHLLEKQGLSLVIEALPLIARKLPSLKLVIIGTGPFERHLKLLVAKLRVGRRVEFRGYVENHRDVEEELSDSTIAVAMYKPDPESFTYFADPAKIKNYLSAGLPVILTDVPPIAEEIAQKRCALIAKYDVYDFADKVDALLTDRRMLSEYSKNAIKFAEQFDWDKVFTEALEKTLQQPASSLLLKQKN
ncbi:MAG: glycosyltransferase [Candidatus Blackburnbacteria bacterium]|nr:glycosyltransferase [Candidatus Blackburnbacteria bacterium]